MSEKKHIDRLFQEKFKDFEVAPKEQVWKNIEHSLKPVEVKKTAVFPLWYKIAGVAAILALVFFVGNWFSGDFNETKVVHTDEETQTEVQQPIENDAESPINAIVIEENNRETTNQNRDEKNRKESSGSFNNTIKTNNISEKQEVQAPIVSTEYEDKDVSKEKEASLVASEQVDEVDQTNMKQVSRSPQTEKVELVANSTRPQKQKSILAKPDQNDFVDKQEKRQEGFVLNALDEPAEDSKTTTRTGEKTSLISNKKKSLVEFASLKEQQEENPDSSTENAVAATSKWQISPFAAPIYYSSFGGGNAVDPSLAQNNSTGGTTMAYGINFSYKVSDRLKIRSGVSQVSMNYHVNDIAFASAIQPSALKNVAYNSTAASLEIVSKYNVVNKTNSLLGTTNSLTSGTLNQQYGFIEVPLELEYVLIDKKFGLSIIGGASTLFLNENDIAIKSRNGVTNIGEANNINQVSFSTNIGLGLGYDITKEFEISLEPMFKYQVNTFSENLNDFKPYYLGIYTGVSFKF